MLRAGFDAEALLGMGMLEDLDGRGFIAPAAPFVQSRRFKGEFYSSLAAKYTCITCPMNTRRIAFALRLRLPLIIYYNIMVRSTLLQPGPSLTYSLAIFSSNCPSVQRQVSLNSGHRQLSWPP